MKLSQLDSFLSTQRSDGVVVNEGSFTLAREKALLKLANFQLPFKGAWAMKVFQAAIAFSPDQPVKFTCSSKDTTVEFQVPETLTIEEIEEAFFNPEQASHRGIRHLLSGLWAAGVAQKHSFALSFPHQAQSLLWTGERLERAEGVLSGKVGTLALRNYPFNLGSSPFSRASASSAWNAETSKALTTYCYTSPVPLTLDGRRLDGLQFSPTHGWNKLNFPLSVTFLEADLPPLIVPPGTLKKLSNEEMKTAKGLGLNDASKSALDAIPYVERTGLALILTAHVNSSGVKNFEPRSEASVCYWVQDGAVVDESRLELEKKAVSVALFINADTIQNDISGLRLAKTPEFEERLDKACRAVLDPLYSVGQQNIEVMISKARQTSKTVGGIFILAGAGLSLISPFHGVSMMAAGAVGIAEGGKNRAKWAKEFQNDLSMLTRQWFQIYG